MAEPSHRRLDSAASKWGDLLNESVHTSDDKDIGDIEAVNRDFVVIKRGFVNVHYYYIPSNKVEGWDGHVLWLKITEDEVTKTYEKDSMPDPVRYLVKEYSNYYRGAYPEITWIPSRYSAPTYPDPATMAPRVEQPLVHMCDLCASTFGDEEKLSKHVHESH